jgi:predicted ATPase with chaperone activity
MLDRIDIHIEVPKVNFEKHGILKLARTIADLARSDEILSTHLAEALQCRPKLMIGVNESGIRIELFGFGIAIEIV